MKTNEIIIKLKNTLEIFERCFVILDDIRYIGRVNDIEKQVIENSNFLMRQIDYEWRLLIIELQKVFKKEEDYSVNKLLNILITNYKTIQWENKIDLDVLKNYELKLKEEKFIEAIKALDTLRSKFIAHLDSNRINYNDKITTEHVELLMFIGGRFLKEANNALIGGSFIFNLFSYSGINTIVDEIIDLQQEKS